MTTLNTIIEEEKKELIKKAVDRFLGWKLPEDFRPDAGISFKAEFSEHTEFPMKHKPIGTNLFDATQAEQMIDYLFTELLTTAMQRAYEAGESEQRERLLGEVKGMKTNLSARARGDDFISQIAIKEVQKHEWSYNQALDAVIEKIKQ